jgi:hypothetical protein
MKSIIIIALLIFPLYSHAQTYLGDGTGAGGLGGSCCNWVAVLNDSNQNCPSDQLAAHPNCVVISSGQYAAYFTAVNNQYNAKYPKVLNAGITITCTCSGYPYGSLNGTYSLSGPEFDNRNLAYLNIKAGGSFPLGQNVVQFADMTGILHTFDAAHLIELGGATQDYLATISAQYVAAAGWPANNGVTIP